MTARFGRVCYHLQPGHCRRYPLRIDGRTRFEELCSDFCCIDHADILPEHTKSDQRSYTIDTVTDHLQEKLDDPCSPYCIAYCLIASHGWSFGKMFPRIGIPGGPGGGGLESMSLIVPLLNNLTGGTYDLVSWDPRGVGALTMYVGLILASMTSSRPS